MLVLNNDIDHILFDSELILTTSSNLTNFDATFRRIDSRSVYQIALLLMRVLLNVHWSILVIFIYLYLSLQLFDLGIQLLYFLIASGQ